MSSGIPFLLANIITFAAVFSVEMSLAELFRCSAGRCGMRASRGSRRSFVCA
ncbi:hypothetical protein BDW74DRAFT_148743 [Aspergillus multicolor]|uniref:uncharacterized protein n=1 Tax=Aspergillus multicolor TaxID=41759 RepID=UPI003CCD59FA